MPELTIDERARLFNALTEYHAHAAERSLTEPTEDLRTLYAAEEAESAKLIVKLAGMGW
jgi:hypothetical protein